MTTLDVVEKARVKGAIASELEKMKTLYMFNCT